MTKVTDTKDFTIFNVDQLVGSLMTHEFHLGTHELDSMRLKALALRIDDQEE